MDVPAPHEMEAVVVVALPQHLRECVEVVSLTPQERVQRVDLLALITLEVIVEAERSRRLSTILCHWSSRRFLKSSMMLVSKERSPDGIVEQTVVPIPQIQQTILELIQLAPQVRIPECTFEQQNDC